MNATAALAIPAPRPASDPRYAVPPFHCYHHVLFAPHVPDVVADLLAWLDDNQQCRAVLDPDARTWLRYDPATGTYGRVAGTAEQAARAFVAEAAEAARRAYDEELPAWRGGSKYPFLHTWKLLTGYDHDPDDPTPESLARAMVDLAAGGERAARTRAELAAGRSPDRLYTPMDWDARYGCWLDDWEGDGVPLDLDGADGYIGYRVPLRAAGYAPAWSDPYDGPPAPHPGFDRLCSLVWPDPAQRDTALRSASMGFTGIATKFVPYWIAETGRGKSLMAAFMSDLLGSYAKSVPAKTLFGYTADPQRAAEELAGVWLAIAEEGIGDRSFKADAAFKMVTTGGADLNARRLYQESRQVQATHTILLAVNPEAAMNYADPAIMARLVPVRFSGNPAAIAEYAKAYNPSSAAWKAEAPAVLATMVTYARDFWSGRWKPRTLADLTAGGAAVAALDGSLDDELAEAVEMRTDTNVGDFIDAMRFLLSSAPGGHRSRKLYEQYEAWAHTAGREAVSETAFGRALKDCDGVTKTRKETGTVYVVAPPVTGQ